MAPVNKTTVEVATNSEWKEVRDESLIPGVFIVVLVVKQILTMWILKHAALRTMYNYKHVSKLSLCEERHVWKAV